MDNLASVLLTIAAAVIGAFATPMGVVMPVMNFRLDRPN